MKKSTQLLAGLMLGLALFFVVPTSAAAVTNSTSVIINPADPAQAPKLDAQVNGTVFDTTKPKMSGTTFPNSRVDIYIYSEPIHGVTYSDATGYWEWTPTVDIPVGKHTVQATVTDSKGNKSMVSTAYSFEVSEKAVASNNSESNKDVAGATTKATTNWVTYAIWGLVVLFLLVGGYAITRRRNVQD